MLSLHKIKSFKTESRGVPAENKRYMFKMKNKAFQQGTIAKHCVRKIKSVVDEIPRRNLLLTDKIVDRPFCDCEDECLWDRWR